MFDEPLDMENPMEENSNQESREPINDNVPLDSTESSNLPPMKVVSDEEIEEVSDSIFNGFQIVRSEFFSQLREPAITFSQGKVGVNSACIKKLPNVDYAQILVNREKKMLAIRPCQETDIFSFRWCSYRTKDHKRQPRQVTGKMFFLKICTLMGWNLDYRYKILGKLIRANNEYLFVFNLQSAQTFVREEGAEGEKPKMSRTPIFPAKWQNQFGIPFEEHQKALQINMFQGFAVYSIKDDTPAAPVQPQTPQNQASPPQTDSQQEGDYT